jgi:hypothetical protein
MHKKNKSRNKFFVRILITGLRIKKGVDIRKARFDSQINSWRDLVRESGATPNRWTYSVHLSVFSKDLKKLGQSCLILDQSQEGLGESVLSREEHSTTLLNRKVQYIGIKLACQALGTADDIWYHGCHISWTRRKGIGGSTMSRPTRPKYAGQVAHLRGGFDDRYRIKSCK